MRCLNRNKRSFYYALFIEKRTIMDEYGNETSESEIVYGKPVSCKGNISAARGETATRQFGEDEGYDRVIVLDKPDTPIDEYAVLWVDSTPSLTEEGELATDENGEVVTPWDYIVKKVARSLNSVSIAISKVNVR